MSSCCQLHVYHTILVGVVGLMVGSVGSVMKGNKTPLELNHPKSEIVCAMVKHDTNMVNTTRHPLLRNML